MTQTLVIIFMWKFMSRLLVRHLILLYFICILYVTHLHLVYILRLSCLHLVRILSAACPYLVRILPASLLHLICIFRYLIYMFYVSCRILSASCSHLVYILQLSRLQLVCILSASYLHLSESFLHLICILFATYLHLHTTKRIWDIPVWIIVIKYRYVNKSEVSLEYYNSDSICKIFSYFICFGSEYLYKRKPFANALAAFFFL